MSSSFRKSLMFVLLCFVFVLMTACNPVVSETAVPMIADATETVVPTEISLPTETPPMPRKLVLSAPLEIDPDLYQSVQDYLIQWTNEFGYSLDVREMVYPEDVQDDWVGVIFLKEPAEISAFQEAAPELMILTISETGLMGDGNLSVIQLNKINQTFAAGFLSVLAAPDWRLGGLLPWDDADSGYLLLDAFTNGAAYYCGRCASTYMPVSLFPVTTSLPSNSSMNDWLEAAKTLNLNYIIYVVYVAPEAASDELIQALYEQNIVMVGGETPPAGVESRWAATVSLDVVAALQTVLPELFTGNSGQTMVVPITIDDVNSDLLSEGRLRLVEDMLELLEEGALLPLSPDYP